MSVAVFSRSVQRMFCVLTLSLNVGMKQFAALRGSIYPVYLFSKSSFGRQQGEEHSDGVPFFDGNGTWKNIVSSLVLMLF